MRVFAASALIAGALATSARADIVVVKDLVPASGRATFNALLTNDSASTIVDTNNAFALDPTAVTGLTSFARTGTIGGQSYAYSAYDVGFSNSPTGTLAPGSVGGDIGATSAIDVETPASQDGATGSGTWGLDSGSVSTSYRSGLLLDFTDTPGGNGIGHFAADLIDWEASSTFTNAIIRLYKNGVLTFSQEFNWDPLDGNGQVHFLGILATDTTSFFDQVLIVLGDDGPGGGLTEQWAADRFIFGQAYGDASLAAAPEPSSFALASTAVVTLAGHFLARRKRSRAA